MHASGSSDCFYFQNTSLNKQIAATPYVISHMYKHKAIFLLLQLKKAVAGMYERKHSVENLQSPEITAKSTKVI